MKNLTLSLLGPPQVTLDGLPVTFESRKAIALLAYLAVTNTDHNRAELATLLWPESDSKRARGALRYTLSLLRKELGEGWLRVEGQTVSLQGHPGFWLDVAQFHKLWAAYQAHHHPPNELCDRCLVALTEAMALYRADFMTGFSLRDSPDFDEWQFFQMESLRRGLASALERLTHYHAGQAEVEKAIAYAHRWLKLDPLHEPVHRELMGLYAAAGQWAAAMRQYEECAQMLDEEFGVSPSPETAHLYERIRGDKATGGQADWGGMGIISSSPPAPTMPAPSQNLPPQSTPFMGREKELADLAQLIENDNLRLLNIVGPGGIGKTRLALEAAAAQRDRFADGVYFVSLAPLSSADNIVPAIAEAIRLSFSEGSEPYTQLLDFLHSRQILLLLDNVEHLLAGSASSLHSFITDVLQWAPRLKVLVTSRVRLKLQAEHIYPLHGLGLPVDTIFDDVVLTGESLLSTARYPALELFQQRARQVQPSLVSPALADVVRICRLTEGMPLAIELAAAMTSVLSLPAIATEIERNLDVLTTDWQDVHIRHRSMRAVFDSSWRALTTSEQAVFARLALFRGGFTREAAEQVAQATLDNLASLVNKSFLHHQLPGRYEIHELMRQYAVEKLAASPGEKETVQRRHSDYYSRFLDRSVARWHRDYRPEIMAHIAIEIDNLRQGWQWALVRQDTTVLLPYTENLWPFYKARGRFSEAVDIFTQTLNSIRANPHGTTREQQAEYERLLGEAYFGLGQGEISQKYLQHALNLVGQPIPATRGRRLWGLFGQILRQIVRRLRPKSGDRPLPDQEKRAFLTAAIAYDRLGQIHYLANEVISASYAVVRGVNLAEKAGYSPTLAIAYANISLLCGLFSRVRWADIYAHLAEKMARKFHDLPAQAAIALRLSVYRATIGQWEQAIAEGQRALRLYQQLEDRRNWGDCLTILGSITFLQGRFGDSITYCAALQTLSNVGYNVEHRIWAICGQALNLLNLGRLEEALALVEPLSALIDQRRIGSTEEALYHSFLAIARLRQGEKTAALQAANVAVNSLRGISPINLAIGISYSSLAEVYLTLWEQAASDAGVKDETNIQHLQTQAQQVCQALGRFAWLFPMRRPFAYLYQGRYDRLAGQSRKARRNWLKSLTHAQRLAIPYVEGAAHFQIGRHLPLGEARRESHLRRAVEVFETLDAAYDLAQVQAALAEGQ